MLSEYHCLDTGSDRYCFYSSPSVFSQGNRRAPSYSDVLLGGSVVTEEEPARSHGRSHYRDVLSQPHEGPEDLDQLRVLAAVAPVHDRESDGKE